MTMTTSAFAIWFTGLPASGKSTLANLLAQEMRVRDRQVQVLDSDRVRKVLTPNPTYDPTEREWFYRSLAYIGGLLFDNGVNVIIAATAHRRDYRMRAREYLPGLIDIYVECPLETCMARDQKGIYTKAMAKEATHVPGIQELYEVPEMPAIIINTEEQSPQECIKKVLERLMEFGMIKEGN